MSLDIYLHSGKPVSRPPSSGIFIREGGSTIEITEDEWRVRYPDREPVRYTPDDKVDDIVFHANITHNLSPMANAANLYTELWTPEVSYQRADELVKPIADGLARLLSDPEQYKKLNPPNGWGNYDIFVKFVTKYLIAAIQHPSATIEVSR